MHVLSRALAAQRSFCPLSIFVCTGVGDVCKEEVMPKVKRSKKKPPEGWELIEPTLDELEQKMREGEYFHQASCSKALVRWF